MSLTVLPPVDIIIGNFFSLTYSISGIFVISPEAILNSLVLFL